MFDARGSGDFRAAVSALGLDDHPFDISVAAGRGNDIEGATADRFVEFVPIGGTRSNHDARFFGQGRVRGKKIFVIAVLDLRIAEDKPDSLLSQNFVAFAQRRQANRVDAERD